MTETTATPVASDADAIKGRHFRYFDFVMAAFVTILLLSNVLGAGKVATIDLPGSAPGRSVRAYCSSRSAM